MAPPRRNKAFDTYMDNILHDRSDKENLVGPCKSPPPTNNDPYGYNLPPALTQPPGWPSSKTADTDKAHKHDPLYKLWASAQEDAFTSGENVFGLLRRRCLAHPDKPVSPPSPPHTSCSAHHVP